MNTVRATIFNIFDDNKFFLLGNSYERVTTAAILKNPLCHTIEVKLHFGPRVRSYWKCRLVGGLGDVAELEREQGLGVRPDGVEGQRRKTNQLHFHGQTQQKLNRDQRTNERVRCRKIMVFEPNNRASVPRMNRKKKFVSVGSVPPSAVGHFSDAFCVDDDDDDDDDASQRR